MLVLLVLVLVVPYFHRCAAVEPWSAPGACNSARRRRSRTQWLRADLPLEPRDGERVALGEIVETLQILRRERRHRERARGG